MTPVKGLRLRSVPEMRLDMGGMPQNRRFYIVDEAGLLVNARRAGTLMMVTSACDVDAMHLMLRFPDGKLVEADIELAEEVETDFWGRPVRGRVCVGPWATALSVHTGRRVRLVRAVEPGAACDVHPVTLVSTASCNELARRAGTPGPDDWRRFRMLITLEGCRPYEEDSWSGDRVRIGETILRVGGPVPRCAVTTLNPATGKRDCDTLRVIRRSRGLRDGRALDFGVYATVEQAGEIRVGDPLMPVALER